MWRLIPFLGLVLAGQLPVVEAAPAEILQWRAKPGDDPAWADPDHDDRDWKVVQVPGSLQNQGIDPAGGFVWYRARLQLPGDTNQEPRALLLGPVYDADEVFLNGALIARRGGVPETWHDYSMGSIYQALPLPADLLAEGDDQVLALRVFSLHGDSGIASGPIALGSPHEMLRRAEESNRPYLYTVLLSISVLVVSGCLTLGIALTRRQLGEHIWLVAFLLALAGVYWLEHLHFLSPEFKTPLVERLANLCIFLAPVALMLHLDALYSRRTVAWQWLLAVATVVWGLLLLVWDLPIPLMLRYGVHGIWLIVAVVVVIVVRSVQAAWHRQPGSWIVLAAIGAGFAGLIVWLAGLSFFLKGVSTMDLGVLATVLLLLLNFGLRTGRERHLLEEYAGGMLSAQESERRRLARDLHDDLGQRLVMTRMRLETAGANLREELQVAARELEDSIDALRGIIAGLSPAALDQVSLGGAIKEFVARSAEASGVVIEVDADHDAEPSEQTKVHLFRIMQEALQNALRHSSAARISVLYARRDNQLVLEVKDNGHGFRPDRDRGRGLGLIAIQERATLCGGAARVSSSGAGTSVRVRVPFS